MYPPNFSFSMAYGCVDNRFYIDDNGTLKFKSDSYVLQTFDFMIITILIRTLQQLNWFYQQILVLPDVIQLTSVNRMYLPTFPSTLQTHCLHLGIPIYLSVLIVPILLFLPVVKCFTLGTIFKTINIAPISEYRKTNSLKSLFNYFPR